ncbi:cathepsin O isoform X1 [Hydra vulgaris]|uniref:Cathepsin O n=1 Tax=Hydra vulgaris TaxID=6087 RepID=T2MFS1_HYDVU|nr:cathepsin O isoform X1 [Hydra vulgaris]
MKALCLLFIFFDCTLTKYLLGKYKINILKEELKVLQEAGRQLKTQKNIEDAHTLLFGKYVTLLNRPYASDTKIWKERLIIFKESLARHQLLNNYEVLYNGTAKYGINQYSDWSLEEFKNYRLTSNLGMFSDFSTPKIYLNNGNEICSIQKKAYPSSKDWIGMSTKIKDQKNCGSCWAFVASEQVETYLAIAGKPIVELSPQELISCSPSMGCHGGNTCTALSWLKQTHSCLKTEKEYPYEAQVSKCLYSNCTTSDARIYAVCGCQSFVGNEEYMIRVLSQKGPLSVNVDAVSWQDYIGGIIQHHCTNKDINHAVQLIGYNLDDGLVPYFVVRNQWGPLFGEDGYLRIKYGGNICGVAEQSSFIVV